MTFGNIYICVQMVGKTAKVYMLSPKDIDNRCIKRNVNIYGQANISSEHSNIICGIISITFTNDGYLKRFPFFISNNMDDIAFTHAFDYMACCDEIPLILDIQSKSSPTRKFGVIWKSDSKNSIQNRSKVIVLYLFFHIGKFTTNKRSASKPPFISIRSRKFSTKSLCRIFVLFCHKISLNLFSIKMRATLNMFARSEDE